MSARLAHEIREALAWRADRTTISPTAQFEGRRTVEAAAGSRGRQYRAIVAAVAVVGAGLGGVVVVSTLDDQDRTVNQSTPITTPNDSTTYTVVIGDYLSAIADAHCVSVADLVEFNDWEDGVNQAIYPGQIIDIPPGGCSGAPNPADGRLTLPADTGFVGWGGTNELDAEPAVTTRIYALDVPTPERSPAVVVEAVDGGWFEPTSEPPVAVTIRDGVVGSLFESVGDTQLVTFKDGGVGYRVTGYNVEQAELLAVAASAGIGGELADPDVLPASVVQQSAGGRFEAWFLSTDAMSAPLPTMYFSESGSDRYVWYLGAADSDLARVNRLFYDRVTEVTINGTDGWVGELDAQAQFRVVMWVAGGRTVMLGGNDFTTEEMLTIARAMRPASEAEWQAMRAASAPADFAGPSTTVILEGSAVSTSTG